MYTDDGRATRATSRFKWETRLDHHSGSRWTLAVPSPDSSSPGRRDLSGSRSGSSSPAPGACFPPVPAGVRLGSLSLSGDIAQSTTPGSSAHRLIALRADRASAASSTCPRPNASSRQLRPSSHRSMARESELATWHTRFRVLMLALTL